MGGARRREGGLAHVQAAAGALWPAACRGLHCLPGCGRRPPAAGPHARAPRRYDVSGFAALKSQFQIASEKGMSQAMFDADFKVGAGRPAGGARCSCWGRAEAHPAGL